MHVCLTRTHIITQRTKIRRRWYVPQKRTVEVCSDLQAFRPKGPARTSPSTFLFLLSSQCQRADPISPSRRPASQEAKPPNSANTTHSPVARQQTCPVRFPSTVGAAPPLDVVNEPGSILHPRTCQHPFSKFLKIRSRVPSSGILNLCFQVLV